MYDLRGGVGAGDWGVTSKLFRFVERGEALGWGVGKDSHGAVRGQDREREREIITLFNSSGNCNTVVIGD